MNENGMAKRESIYAGQSGGIPHRVPRVVHSAGIAGVPGTPGRSSSLFDLHRASTWYVVPNGEQNRPAGEEEGGRKLVHTLIDLALGLGSLYIIIFIVMLVL